MGLDVKRRIVEFRDHCDRCDQWHFKSYDCTDEGKRRAIIEASWRKESEPQPADQAELFAPLDVATPAPGVELQLDIFGGAQNAKGDPHLKVNAGSTDLFENH